jgi:hypothetical protein
MRRLAPYAVLLVLSAPAALRGEEKTYSITITAGKQDYKDMVVCVPLSLPKALATNKAVVELKVDGARIGPSQLTAPGLLTDHIKPSAPGLVRRDLHLHVISLKAGNAARVDATVTDELKRIDRHGWFAWYDTKGRHAELRLEGRPVLRYMYEAYDNSSPQARDKTYKVFHHLFDPAGKRIVTNGGQTDENITNPKKLLYPHHRGLMFAYNKITFGPGKGTTADTWHAKPGDTHQSHAGFAVVEGGPVLGRHRVLVDWHGPKNEVFAREERELTVYNVPGGTLVQFVTRLKTTGGTVKLAGDPQHAGFQFRAHNDVAEKSAKQTYYLRPDGKGEPGKTRNWDPKTKKGPVNLPWDAMSFVLDGKRFTAAYLNHPSNPGESRWSERDYGRFGCYFPYELTPERPLVATYRVWLQDGEMTGPQVEALHTSFTNPPTVAVK